MVEDTVQSGTCEPKKTEEMLFGFTESQNLYGGHTDIIYELG